MSGVAFNKSKRFAVRIVRVFSYLRDIKKEYVMCKQLLRSGTSIGANLAEAECAISKSDFLSKVYIALKETAETMYWLELLYDTGYLNKQQYTSLYTDAEEIKRLLTATTKTIRQELS